MATNTGTRQDRYRQRQHDTIFGISENTTNVYSATIRLTPLIHDQSIRIIKKQVDEYKTDFLPSAAVISHVKWCPST